MVLGAAVLGFSAAMATWIAPFDAPATPPNPAPPNPVSVRTAATMSFDARFLQGSATLPYVSGFAPRAAGLQSLSPEVDMARARAKALLAEKLQAHSRQGTPF